MVDEQTIKRLYGENLVMAYYYAHIDTDNSVDEGMKPILQFIRNIRVLRGDTDKPFEWDDYQEKMIQESLEKIKSSLSGHNDLPDGLARLLTNNSFRQRIIIEYKQMEDFLANPYCPG